MQLYTAFAAMAYMLLFFLACHVLAGSIVQAILCRNRTYGSTFTLKALLLFMPYSWGEAVENTALKDGNALVPLLLKRAATWGKISLWGSSLGVLAVSPGSLGALLVMPWAGVVPFAALLVWGVWNFCLKGNTGAGQKWAVLPAVLGVLCVYVLLAGISWHRGLPGYVGHFDTFAAHPLWFALNTGGKLGLFCLLAGLCSLGPNSTYFMVAQPDAERTSASATSQVLQGNKAVALVQAIAGWVGGLMLWGAVVTALLLPWNVAPLLPGVWWGVADFFLFWCKVVVLLGGLVPLCRLFLGQRVGMFLLFLGTVLVVWAGFWGQAGNGW